MQKTVLLKILITASKNIYQSYYYFNSEKSETPTKMIKEINKHFKPKIFEVF